MAVLKEPLPLQDAERLAKGIIRSGDTSFSQHARDEMQNDNLTDRDVTNVIRGGYCESVDFQNGTWRYRLRTQRIVTVVAFASERELRIVTAWRVVR